jgi:hypothetical protein
MAVSENLLINVKVKKDGSIKGAELEVSAFQEALSSLKSEIKLLSESTNRLSRENEILAKSFKNSNSDLKHSEKSFKDIAAGAYLASSAMDALSKAVSMILTADSRKRLIDILRIFAALADSKGLTRLSDRINYLKEMIVKLDEVMREYHLNSTQDFGSVADYIEKQILLYKTFSAVAIAGVIAATAYASKELYKFAMSLDEVKYAIYRVRNIYFRLDDILRRPEGMEILKREIWATAAAFEAMTVIYFKRFKVASIDAMKAAGVAAVDFSQKIKSSIENSIGKSLFFAEQKIIGFKNLYISGIKAISGEVAKEFKDGFSLSKYLTKFINDFRSEYASVLMMISVNNISIKNSFVQMFRIIADAGRIAAIGVADVILTFIASVSKFSGISSAVYAMTGFFKDASVASSMFFESMKKGTGYAAAFNASMASIVRLFVGFLPLISQISIQFIPIISIIFNIQNAINVLIPTLKVFYGYLQTLSMFVPSFVSSLKNIGSSFAGLVGSIGILFSEFGKNGYKDLTTFFTKLKSIFSALYSEFSSGIVEFVKKIPSSLSSAWSGVSGFLTKLADSGASALLSGFNSLASKSTNVGKSIFEGIKSGLARGVKEVFTNADLIVKAGAFVTHPLLLFGNAALSSDSGLVKFAGTLSIVAGILIGGFSAAIVYALGAIGNFVESIGDKLISTMDKMEEKFIKSQQVVKSFAFVVTGFGKTFGESTIGSLEQWQGVVSKITEKTIYGTDEVNKAIKIMIAEGAALGLNFTQNVELLNRALDVSASQGRDLTEVAIALASGLMGQSQSVLSLGINLKESHLEHSKFLVSQNKLLDDLSDTEKVQLRYNEVLAQTVPILGAASSQMDTVAGSSRKLEQAVDSISVKLGAMGFATEYLLKTQRELASVFLSLPDVVLNVIGVFWDFSGVILKITGILIKYAVIISSLAVTYKILLWATTQNAMAQGVLTVAMNVLGNAAGVQTVAVTSLGVAWSNLLLILRGGAIAVLKTVWATISAVTIGLVKFGAALLANPMTWVIAATATVVFAFVQSLNDLSKELSFLKSMFSSASEEVSIFSKITSAILAPIKFVWNAIYVYVKTALLGIIESVLLVQAAYYKMRAVFAMTREDQDKYNKSLDQTIKNLKETDQAVKKTYDSLQFSLGGVAHAAEATTIKFSEMEEKARLFSLRAAKVSESISGISKESLKIEVLGSDIERATMELSKHKIELDDMIKKYVEHGSESKDALDQIKQKQEEVWRSEFQIQKARNDAVKAQIEALTDIKRQNEDLATSIENMGASQFDIINRQVAGEIKKLELKKEQLRIEGKLSKAAIAAIDEQKALVQEKGEKDKSKIGKTEIISRETIDSLRASVGDGAADLAAGVSGAFSSFAGGVGAVMSAVNAVLDFAQQIIDFIPQVLNKIANLFNSLTELPLKILEGVQNIVKSIFNFIENFAVNIVTMLEGIGEVLANFLLDLPTVFDRLLEKLPAAFLKLIDRLPDFVTRLTEGLIAHAPEIAIALVEVLIEKAPYIAYKIVELMAIKLPVAIVRGVIKAFESIFKRLGNAFSGTKLPKSITDLPKNIAKGADKLGRNIAKETSQIFAVKNLEEAAKNAQFTQTFDESMKKAFDVWGYIVDRLMAAFNYFRDMWLRFLDALTQVFEGVKQAFQMVGEMMRTIFNGVVTAIRGAFEYGANLIRAAAYFIGSSGYKIWDGFKNAIGSAGSFFEGLGSKIVEGFRVALSALNPGNLLSKMFTFDGGGRDKVEQALGIDVPFVAFAQGGMVPGAASVPGDSSINDKILALLSPGEYVIPRSAMAIPGVADIVRAVSSGNIDALNLFGGGVGKALSGGASALGGAASSIGGAISQGGKDAWATISEAAQETLNELARLDPTQLWKLVEDKVFEGIWQMVTHSAPKFHTGGLVPSFADGGDVMSRLQPGEFVMQRSAVNANGLDFMNRINNGQPAASSQTYNFDVNLSIDASAQSLDDNYVRNKLIPAIKTEFKKSSLRGEFLMSDKGLR